jgi:hypothetical protein
MGCQQRAVADCVQPRDPITVRRSKNPEFTQEVSPR